MKLAVCCPGQGILARGSLARFAGQRPQFQKLLDEVDESLGEKFTENLFAPPQEKDRWSMRTSNAQPAILTATAVTAHLLQGFGVDLRNKASFFLGHSLGEYLALVLAGSVPLGEMARVVRRRGQLMEKLAADLGLEFTMKTLLLRPNQFEHAASAAKTEGVLACVNSLRQIAVSGEAAQIDGFLGRVAHLKSVTLPVKIPFHSRLLAPIEPELRRLVLNVAPPAKPIVANLTGTISEGNVFENTVADNSQPVLWKKCMEYVVDQGVTDVLNLGPGTVLQDINRGFSVKGWAATELADLERFASILS